MKRFALWRSFLLAMIAGLTLLWTEAAPVSPPSVLLITLDTTRADRLGCYGYKKARTPNIDRLASEGALFESAFTSSPVTLPAHASLLTGLYPTRTGVRDNALFRLPAFETTLAEILQNEGYHTYAFISAAVLDREFGLNQGFHLYDDNVRVGRPEAFNYEERAASQTNEAVFGALPEMKLPCFLWVHYYDPHFPFVPPRQFEDFEDPYDGEIAFVDWAVGKLLDRMKQTGMLQNTIIVIAGDHGESLGEHGEKTHGIFIYDSTMHVPLIVHYPPKIPAHSRLTGLSRLIDVMPTILEFGGFSPARALDGRSLVQQIRSGKSAGEMIYQETFYAQNTFGWSPLFGLRTPEWHLIVAPQKELYNVRLDREEKDNVLAKNTAQLRALESKLKPFVEKQTRATVPEVSPELREQIESLGYVGSPTKPAGTAIDPKKGVAWSLTIERARELAARGETEPAIKMLREVLGQNKENVSAHNNLGNIFLGLRKPAEAQKEFEAALRVREFDYLRHNLGRALAAQGETVAARKEFQKSLALNSRFVDAYISWALLEINAGNTSKAGEILDAAISKNIRDPGLYILRGKLAAERKDLDAALGFFDRALELNPDSSEAFAEKGHVFYARQSYDEAVSAYEEAVSIDPQSTAYLKTLASIYLVHKNDASRARVLFQKALDIAPNAPDADELRQILQSIPEGN